MKLQRIVRTISNIPGTPDIFETETSAPPADRFLGHDASSFGKKILNISEAQPEFVVEPDGMTDDFRWTTAPVIGGRVDFMPQVRQVWFHVDGAVVRLFCLLCRDSSAGFSEFQHRHEELRSYGSGSLYPEI